MKRPARYSGLDQRRCAFTATKPKQSPKLSAGQSVVTTGTGSGKSLCFFVPVVDAIIRARKAGKPRKTSAIIVYPMNALANSQMNEIREVHLPIRATN
jgi:superfamily II DNA helicase RecQ